MENARKRMSFYESVKRVRFLGGSRNDPAGTHILISKSKDNIDQEQDSVDDGQWALGDAEGFAVVRCKTNDLSANAVVPVLQDQNTRGNEQGTTDQGEEKICEWITNLISNVVNVQTYATLPSLLLMGVFIM